MSYKKIMKVCIVTVYNGMNSGSFWQAYALGITLKEMGNEVYYLDRKGEGTSSKFYQICKIIKTTILDGINSGVTKTKSFKGFLQEQKVFNVLPMKKIKEMDCFIIGSDTIWNMESKHFRDNYKIYWGVDLFPNNINIYAGSVANTSYELISKYKEIPTAVNKWNKISVRDNNTYEVLKKITNKDIEIVCDPTLLLNKEYYKKIQPKPIEESKYIFLYLFNTLSELQIKELLKFAKEKNLSIISGFDNFKYCDKTIVNTPSNFLNYMLYADYIITDTFHGNVFSVNLQKQFISIDRNKSKVTDLLKRFELQERLVDEKEVFVEKMIEKIDYSKKEDKIEEFRKKSLDFINSIVGENIDYKE